MAVVKPDERKVLFYGANDLRRWERLSEFGGVGDGRKAWECPDLVQVPVSGQPGKTKWVLLVSSNHSQAGYTGMQYFVGNFDGKAFTPDEAQPTTRYVDYGKDFYAGITYANLPDAAKGPVLVGWLTNLAYAGQIPTGPYRGTQSIPRRLSLVSTPTGWQLRQTPVETVASLRGSGIRRSNVALMDKPLSLTSLATDSYEIDVTIDTGQAEEVGIRLLKTATDETVVRFRPRPNRLELDRTRSGQTAFSDRFSSVESAALTTRQKTVHLHLLVDRSTLELFANDGEVTMSELIFPNSAPGRPEPGRIEFYAKGGSASVRELNIWPLKASLPTDRVSQ